jgi:hypothetical protein
MLSLGGQGSASTGALAVMLAYSGDLETKGASIYDDGRGSPRSGIDDKKRHALSNGVGLSDRTLSIRRQVLQSGRAKSADSNLI